MSNDAKRWKGQIQTYEGGPSGESLPTTLYAYTAIGLVEFIGEAKLASQTNAPKWFIQKMEYNQILEVSKMATAVNEITTKSGQVVVNPFNASETSILIDGDFTELTQIGDKVFLKTSLNKIGGSRITKILSNNTIVVENSGQVLETATIADSDLVIMLESPDYKDFNNRIWDLRENYVYR